MLTVFYTGRKNGWVLVLLAAMLASCHTDTTQFSAVQSALVRDSVRQLAEGISRDVSHDGPAAWLKYFEASPEFYMASEGVCVFPDINSATGFINKTLIKEVHSIQLRWSDLRIDPYSPVLAGMAATYHEDLTDTSGKVISEDGYFTGMAGKTAAGWQLRNAHWSTRKGK